MRCVSRIVWTAERSVSQVRFVFRISWTAKEGVVLVMSVFRTHSLLSHELRVRAIGRSLIRSRSTVYPKSASTSKCMVTLSIWAWQ